MLVGGGGEKVVVEAAAGSMAALAAAAAPPLRTLSLMGFGRGRRLDEIAHQSSGVSRSVVRSLSWWWWPTLCRLWASLDNNYALLASSFALPPKGGHHASLRDSRVLAQVRGVRWPQPQPLKELLLARRVWQASSTCAPVWRITSSSSSSSSSSAAAAATAVAA